VERLQIEELSPAPPKRAKPEVPWRHAPDDPGPRLVAPAPPDTAQTAKILEVYRLLGLALSARVLLLLAIIGAFVLALYAMREQTTESLLVLSAFVVGTVLPTTFLEVRRRS
jgi:hypothetical protein